VKRCFDFVTTRYDNVFVSQAVQTAKKILRTEVGVTIKIGDLGAGMHAGICSTGSRQGYLAAGNGEDRLFDFILDRPVIFLTLPAMIAGTVVLDSDFKIFYPRQIKLRAPSTAKKKTGSSTAQSKPRPGSYRC